MVRSAPCPEVLCSTAAKGELPARQPLDSLSTTMGSVAAGRDGGKNKFDSLKVTNCWGGCDTTAPPDLPPQVLRDYLQGKLMISAQADAQLARLAALQHLRKASKSLPSECVSSAQPLASPSPSPKPPAYHLSSPKATGPNDPGCNPRQELLVYIPKPLQQQVNIANIRSLVGQELRQMQGYSAQRAQIDFIGGSTSRESWV